MSRSAACGRADLLRVLALGDEALTAAAAELLGFVPGAPALRQPPPGPSKAPGGEGEGAERPPPVIEARPPVPTPFWCADNFEPLGPPPTDGEPAPSARPIWRHRPREAPPLQPLASWRDLQSRLRGALRRVRVTRAIDVDATVSRLSRGRQLDRLPRLRRRRWGGRVQVILDRSDRLVPFWADQERVCAELRRLVPAHELEFAVMHETLDVPQPLGGGAPGAYQRPPPGGWVLALSDLGCLTRDHGRSLRPWLNLGRRLQAAGCQSVALLPCPVELVPSWADDWGEDDHGKWVTFSLKGADGEPVTQRLRWIPPGRFLMGSPEDEADRFDDEGPRHEVTIGRGFWLGDTPVTQALWAAVMGESDNPSRFRTPSRPVENVSWDDAQRFLERLNERVPGLGLALPSEAQWEYACRAGTETATYAGELEILGDSNAPALDGIAWYGGNSGIGFELAEGEDSSDWREKQHPHEWAGTRPVGLKRPNPWGLYDMLGNVWEWCADHWHDSYGGAPSDGSAWLGDEPGAHRVVRGGSWRDVARDVRAAYRLGFVPDIRNDRAGFRCARVRA